MGVLAIIGWMVPVMMLFYIGWYGTLYESEGNMTSGFGLRFLPPCTPFGANATCGYDILFLLPLGSSFVMVAIDGCEKSRLHHE